MEMKLNKLTQIRTGVLLARKRANGYEDNLHYYKSLTLKSFVDSDIYPQVDMTEEFCSVDELSSNYLTEVGDIVVRLRIPSNAILITEESSGMLISSLMSVIKIKDKTKVDPIFLVYYLNSKKIQGLLAHRARGTAISMIKNSDLAELDVTLPDLATQQKVCQYLFTANQEIKLLKQLLEQKQKLNSEILEQFI